MAATTYTTYIYTTDPKIQTDLMADLTTQFNVSFTTKQYFTNSWFGTIIGETGVTCSGSQLPCDLDKDIQDMIAVSTGTYMYGVYDGMITERHDDENIVSDYDVHCDTPSYFSRISTTPWDWATCTDALGSALGTISQQDDVSGQ